jgi:hypothetical protein
MSYLKTMQQLRPSQLADYYSDNEKYDDCKNDIDIENQYDDYEPFVMDNNHYRPENPMFKILLQDGEIESDNDYNYNNDYNNNDYYESNEDSETENSKMFGCRKRRRILTKENIDLVDEMYRIPTQLENGSFQTDMTMMNESESVCSSFDFEIANTFSSNCSVENNMISYRLATTSINGNS